MSAAERDKWDERYRAGAYEHRTHPTALLAEWLPHLRRGTALDVACGAGRNALFLAAQGFSVDALDVSSVGLERGRRGAAENALAVRWLCADLDEPGTALPAARYDLIVWVRYVHGGLMPHVIERLRPGGTLLCEQHLAADGDVAGPTNPAFRLQRGDLLRSAAGLIVLHHNEGATTDPDGRTVSLAQLVAAAPS